MNIFYKKNPLLGGPGEAYVESRGTKVSWRPHHTREQGKTIMTIEVFHYVKKH